MSHRSRALRGMYYIVIGVLFLLPSLAQAQGKAIAEGVQLFSRSGGEAGRAFVVLRGGEAVRTMSLTGKVLQSSKLLESSKGIDCLGSTVPSVSVSGLTESIDEAAKLAAVGGGSEDAATLMSKLGMDEVTEVGTLHPTDVDGFIVATTRNGDMAYIDPHTPGMSMEDILALAREHALIPEAGVSEGGLSVYTNGIRNTPQQHAETMKIIAEITGRPTLGVYNATEGGLKDAAQTAVDRFANLKWRLETAFGGYRTGPIGNNPAVSSVAQVQIVFAREGTPLNYFFHSQGGVIGSRGVQRATDVLADEGGSLKNTRIISMGSAAPVWVRNSESGPEMFEHYVHVGDLTPRALGLGGNYRSLFGADFWQTGGPPNAIIHRFAGEAPEFVPAQGRLRDWLQIGNQRVKVVANHDVNNTYLHYYAQMNPGSTTLKNVNDVTLQGDLSRLGVEGLMPEAGVTLDAADIASINQVAGRYELRLNDGRVIYTDRLITQ